MDSELVSIIIPTYNEEKVIGKLLISLKIQSYENKEIIVVDDASIDKTVEISKKYASKVFERKHAERSVQRNFGAKKAKGEYLLFLDADMELTKNVVRDCVRQIKNDKSIGAVTIPEKPIAGTFWEKVKAFEREIYNEKGDEATDAARFFTREAFLSVGGYDETITGPEDWDLPESIKRSGYRISRIEAKILHYERVPNPFALARKKYYYGLRSYHYFQKHGISVIGGKAIYFLRPVFYRNWRKLLSNPLLSLGMFVILTLEQIGGGLGYLVGRVKHI